MDRSAVISGMTYQHKYELCEIQCKGKDLTSWGAIAYSKKDNVSGWSFEQGDRASAERLALQYCRKEGGVNCVIETSFNATCGAVAADGDVVAWGTAVTKPGATRSAMAECAKLGGKNCAVEASVCSANGSSNSPAKEPASAPPKAISWGAIAYSAADMGAGWSQGKNDRASAEKEAMAACTQRGKECVLRTAFNKQCGALAADRNFTGFGVSADQRQALQKALEECTNAGGTRCVPHISFCSF
jgi:DNA-binding CsgD family transcriptional regulator